MRTTRLLAGATLVFAGAVLAQCSRGPEPAPVTATPSAGDLTPVASIHEMMRDIIDPVSDLIFDAVGTDVTDQGVVEREPRTDEDWARIRHGALTIAEGANLLKVPRKAAPDGYTFDPALRGPNAPELAPDDIAARIERTRGVWNGMADGLRLEAMKILAIVDARDTSKLFQAGADLDTVCETCHLEYFYPGDRQTVLEDRDKGVTITPPGQ